MAYSFFGVQVAFKRVARDPLRGQLHDLLARDAAGRQSVGAKQRFWGRVYALLTNAPIEYGNWDLVRGANAQDQFNEWASEIESNITTDPDRAGASAQRSSSSYVLATAIFLVDRGSNADQTLGNECDIPESEWLTRQTFARLLAIFPQLNFANVQADAVYVVPGADRDGPTARELISPDYGLTLLS